MKVASKAGFHAFLWQKETKYATLWQLMICTNVKEVYILIIDIGINSKVTYVWNRRNHKFC